MSTEHAFENGPLQPPVKPPECPRCAAPMRLTSIVPHEHYHNLEERRFTCAACGTTFADAVALLTETFRRTPPGTG